MKLNMKLKHELKMKLQMKLNLTIKLKMKRLICGEFSHGYFETLEKDYFILC